jgi:WhiB family redox-sensing transcriptional regulator
VGRPAWMADAACREHPEVNFFPGRGRAAESAKAVCRACLVREECLAYALEHHLVGVWGGTTERERRSRTPGRPKARRAS